MRPLAVLLLAATSCGTPPATALSMGSYEMRSTFSGGDCQQQASVALSAPYVFSMNLSTQNADSGTATLGLAGCTDPDSNCARPATWDGQIFVSEDRAVRQPSGCPNCEFLVTETIAVSLLSQSQAYAVGGGCPADALDGGTPSPNPETGLSGPSFDTEAFDAVLACGTLTLQYVPNTDSGTGCTDACAMCTAAFELQGTRR